MQNPIAHKYTVFLLLGVALIAALLIYSAPEPEQTVKRLQPMQVDSTTAQLRSLRPQVVLSGYLEPGARAGLRFEVEGVLARRLVEPGRGVAAGEPLLGLAAADYRDAVTEAEALLTQEQKAIVRDRRLLKLAGDSVALQSAEVERQQRLGRDSLASKTNLDGARQQLLQFQAEQARLKQAVDSGDARLAIRKAAVDRARRNLARCTLKAPFAGVVNTVSVEPGDFVARNQQVLELVALESLDAYVEVAGEVAAALAPGLKPEVRLPGGASVIGEIIALQPAARGDTSTHGVSVRIDNPGLSAGTLVELVLPLKAIEAALTVPVTAILQEDGAQYLYVVGEADQAGAKLERRRIDIGIRQGEWQQVLSGVEVGERIVSRGAAALSDGALVIF